MSIYVIAQLTIHDRARYERYVARFMEVLAPYRGRVLAADDSPEVLEGTWPHQRVVVLSFPDRDEVLRWSTSDAYREIARDRLAASEGPILLVHGL